MNAITDKLRAHLASHNCTDLSAGQLRIGKHMFDACLYTQDGRRRAYVAGERPPILKRKRKMAIHISGDIIGRPRHDDWYVAAYIDGARIEPKNAPYHPFGANFLIALWDAEDAIDKFNYWRGEHKSYLRIVATFTESES